MMMDYSNKRKQQVFRELIYNKRNAIKNIDDLLNADNLSCQINGENNRSFHKPNNHMSFRKELIKDILTLDRDYILQEIQDIEKKLEELKEDDIYNQ